MTIRSLFCMGCLLFFAAATPAVASPFAIVQVESRQRAGVIDMGTIRHGLTRTTYWLYVVLPPPAPTQMPDIAYYVFQVETNCNGRHRRLSDHAYSIEGRVLAGSNTPDPWSSDIPESNADRSDAIACGKRAPVDSLGGDADITAMIEYVWAKLTPQGDIR